MKFKNGDKVSFLNDVGGGVVNRVDNRGYVYVLTEDGFEIPVLEKELVHSRNTARFEQEDETIVKTAFPQPAETRKKSSEKKVELPLLPENVPADSTVHVMMGFIPESQGPVFTSKIACYLINDSPFFMYYVMGKKEGGQLTHLASGSIEADTKNYIITIDQTGISKISEIHIQLLFVSKGRYARKEPVDKLLNLNLVNFSKESYYRENDYFEEKAVLFNLAGDHIKDIKDSINISDEMRAIKREADAEPISHQQKKEPVKDSLEVDLHYDEIALQNTQLSPGAILALQLSRFHAAIEEAISKRIRRVVIIHGLGQGTLKMQIRKELQEKYPQYIYQDASFKEYGFGATMVHLIIDK